MFDSEIAVALAGIVLAIALTLRFSRPLSVGRRRADASAFPEWPVHDAVRDAWSGIVPPARLAGWMPAGLTLYARVTADAGSGGTVRALRRSQAAAELIVCDRAHRPICAILPADASQRVANAGALPIVRISAPADRATVAALVATAAAERASHPAGVEGQAGTVARAVPEAQPD